MDERPRLSGVATAQWTIGLLMAASVAVLSVWARLPLPYRDDWDWLRWLLGPTPPSAYFVPHNEHLIPVARLLLQLQYALEGSNGYTMLGVSLASLGVVTVLTLAEIRRRWSADGVTRRWASGLALTLLCFAWQLQSLVFPAAVQAPLVEMFAVASLTCLLNAAETSGRRRRRWLFLTLLCVAGAMLTATNGLPVPVMLAMVAAGRRMPRRLVAALLLVGAASIALYVRFVLLLPHMGAGGALDAMAPAWLVAAFFLAFYSSLLAQVSNAGGVIVGTLLFVTGLHVVYTTLTRRDRPRLEYWAAGVLLFTMASAALAAPARASLGIVQVAQSRYASFVLPFWAALCLVGVSRLAPHRLRAVAVLALAASSAAVGLQIVIGAVWIAKAEHVATAGLALASGGGDDEWLATLHPSAEVTREVFAALIADGDRSLGPPMPQLSPDVVARAAACDATARVVPVPVGSGMRLHANVAAERGRGVILDRTGRSVGLAMTAPVVATPNPSPIELAHALARAARAPAPAQPQWIGFAANGAGMPYVLVLLGTDGVPICRVTVTGP